MFGELIVKIVAETTASSFLGLAPSSNNEKEGNFGKEELAKELIKANLVPIDGEAPTMETDTDSALEILADPQLLGNILGHVIPRTDIRSIGVLHDVLGYTPLVEMRKCFLVVYKMKAGDPESLTIYDKKGVGRSRHAEEPDYLFDYATFSNAIELASSLRPAAGVNVGIICTVFCGERRFHTKIPGELVLPRKPLDATLH